MSPFATSALLLLAFSQAFGQSGPPYFTALRVAGWTTSSERLEKIWVVVSSQDGREEYTGSGRDVTLSIPTGDYMLQVKAPGFETKRQALYAYQPTVFRSVALPIAWVHGRVLPSLKGNLRNYGARVQDLRVRLVGLYGSEVWEAIPDARGSFQFPCDAGPYLLVVIRDLKKGIAIIDSEPVRVPLDSEQTIDIDLAGKAGMPTL